MKTRRFLIASGLVLLAGVICVMQIVQAAGRQKMALPDGTVIVLERVEYSQSHRYAVGFARLNRLKRFVPALYRNLFPYGEECSFTGENPTLCFWFSCPKNRAPGNTRPTASLVDEHGCAYLVRTMGIHHFQTKDIFYVVADHFPRGSEPFILRDSLGTNQLIWRVKNRWSFVEKDWRAENLPITRANGELAVTLTNLSLKRDTNGVFSALPEFRLMVNQRPGAQWAIAEARIESPFGNISDFRFIDEAGGLVSIMGLCPFEPAWKLDVRFQRTAEASFSTNELWTVPGLSRPEPGTFFPIAATRKYLGLTFQLHSLNGPGEVVYSNRVPVQARLMPNLVKYYISGSSIDNGVVEMITQQTGSASVAMTARNLDKSVRLLMFLEDEKGRKIAQTSQGSSVNEMYVFTLNWPVDMPKANLNIVVEDARKSQKKLEFLVKPPVPP